MNNIIHIIEDDKKYYFIDNQIIIRVLETNS